MPAKGLFQQVKHVRIFQCQTAVGNLAFSVDIIVNKEQTSVRLLKNTEPDV
jgi:hypothetical protein